MLKLRDRDFSQIIGAAAILLILLVSIARSFATESTTAKEPQMPSPAFQRFRFSFFTDPDSARDGLDVLALSLLEGEQRTRAEHMLIEFLPDTRAVIGLGVLRSLKAEPRLRQLFAAERMAWHGHDGDWSPYRLIELAKALWLIHPAPLWLEIEIEVLGHAEDPVQRQTAAEALYVFHDPAASPPLVKALDDPYSLVRYHAARALLALHGLPHESKDPQHMIYRVMSEDPARHQGGKRAILEAIAGWPITPP